MATNVDLITRYVERDPRRPGSVAEARIVGTALPVWALVGYFQAVGQDLDRVADDYDVSHEIVEAALAFYARHRTAIDERIAANLA